MKLFITLAVLFSTQAFAANEICKYEETWEFKEVHTLVKESNNPKKFTATEKQMIHLAVSQQSYLKGVTKDQAIQDFVDSDGSIEYYQIDGKLNALVHYYPGDNEFGGYFEMSRTAFKIIADVSDSFITCK